MPWGQMSRPRMLPKQTAQEEILTPEEGRLCDIVVEVLMERHRERKRASDTMPRGFVRRSAKLLEGKR